MTSQQSRIIREQAEVIEKHRLALNRQHERLTIFADFLAETDQVNTFNAWEEKRK